MIWFLNCLYPLPFHIYIYIYIYVYIYIYIFIYFCFFLYTIWFFHQFFIFLTMIRWRLGGVWLVYHYSDLKKKTYFCNPLRKDVQNFGFWGCDTSDPPPIRKITTVIILGAPVIFSEMILQGRRRPRARTAPCRTRLRTTPFTIPNNLYHPPQHLRSPITFTTPDNFYIHVKQHDPERHHITTFFQPFRATTCMTRQLAWHDNMHGTTTCMARQLAWHDNLHGTTTCMARQLAWHDNLHGMTACMA